MKLILLRHGESQWNLENRFTGWTDVDLTQNGIKEAKFAANQIRNQKIKFKTIYTSLLKRAQHTTDIVISSIDFPKSKVQIDWRLNERHYGALQGLNKAETAKKYGEDQVHIWRRSYSTPPPLLEPNDKRHPKFNSRFNSISNLPTGESLKDVIQRLKPFLDSYFDKIQLLGGNHMIIAHSNSLRAIVKILDQLSDNEVMSLNIPTGVPIMYEFDSDFIVKNKEFLIDQKSLNSKIDIVKKQGEIV